jgi:hypothetical protein
MTIIEMKPRRQRHALPGVVERERQGFNQAQTLAQRYASESIAADAQEFFIELIARYDELMGRTGPRRGVVPVDAPLPGFRFDPDAPVVRVRDHDGATQELTPSSIAEARGETAPEDALWALVLDGEWDEISWVYPGNLGDLTRRVNELEAAEAAREVEPWTLFSAVDAPATAPTHEL